MRKPPGVIASRIKKEICAELERINGPRRARRLTERRLLDNLRAGSLDELWARLASGPSIGACDPVRSEDYERLCPGDAGRILTAADKAMDRQVDLLGSGPVSLGKSIDWHKDYKSGQRWTPRFFRRIDYNDRGRQSDVKFPWEVSRMQWLLPAGQAFLLTGEERYAECVRDVLDDWMRANPYVQGVNWAVTMEVALRIVAWVWFFHVFSETRVWKDERFRADFLRFLYLHADFTERHLERSDINGNHFTANAAGLLVAGLFFGRGKAPKRWAGLGWKILSAELPRQVHPDGVDFEASVAYHRLVLELFLLPALYREKCGWMTPAGYKQRLAAMAGFSADYSRPDGSVPSWGDADDARLLPLGGQNTNDHRYLPGLVGAAWNIEPLKAAFAGPKSEIYWLLGAPAAASLPSSPRVSSGRDSVAYEHGGVYIMRSGVDHVFIDCGPVGLAGRGGHGHNDCLSFEAVLDGVHLVSDCGSYVYTASYEERNKFRSTRFHNTPIIDDEEINRFISPEYLWNLRYDARPECRRWRSNGETDLFQGSHSGYARLSDPVRPVRTLLLDKDLHALLGIDAFEGNGSHEVEIPFHLAAGVYVESQRDGGCVLSSRQRKFVFLFDGGGDWKLEVGDSYVSPRYGVRIPVSRLSLNFRGNPRPLGWAFVPEKAAGEGERVLRELMRSTALRVDMSDKSPER